MTVEADEPECPLCRRAHTLLRCSKYAAAEPRTKRKWLQEDGRCFLCLRKGHLVRECTSKRVCVVDQCGEKHHISIHDEAETSLREPSRAHATVASDGESAGEEDMSLWFVSTRKFIPQAMRWAGDAVVEIRVYWGCAVWGRVQLLGEIARGGWGLAKGQIDTWNRPIGDCWQSTLKRAIFAGSNDMSVRFSGDDD